MEYLESPEWPPSPPNIRRSPTRVGLQLLSSPETPPHFRTGRISDIHPRTLFATPSIGTTTSRSMHTGSGASSSTTSRSQASHTRNSKSTSKADAFVNTERAEANMAEADQTFQDCGNQCGKDQQRDTIVIKGATLRHVRSIRNEVWTRVERGCSLLAEKKASFFGALRHSDRNAAGEPVAASINVPDSNPSNPQQRISVCVPKCLAKVYDVSNPFTAW